MEQKWYYAVGGVQQGPVSFEELQGLVLEGRIGVQDLVWEPEFGASWRVAGSVAELRWPERGGSVPVLDAAEVPLTGIVGERPGAMSAASDAWSRTLRLLFSPFDAMRWFGIAFCAWLALVNLPPMNNRRGAGAEGLQTVGGVDYMRMFFDKPENVSYVIGQVCGLLMLGVLLCWLRSRGEFMFVRRWYEPDESVGACWRASRVPGDALFKWWIGFAVAVCALFAAVGAGVFFQVVHPFQAAGKVWNDSLRLAAILWGTATMLLVVCLAVVAHLVKAFVVPVMYWRGVSAGRAWRAVFSLCNQYPFAVLGYLVYAFVCALLTGFAVLTFFLVAHFCHLSFLAVPLAIPYVNAVLLLPVLAFFRGFPICFIGRWRSDLVPPEP